MTVQTTTNVATGIGNGVTTVFPVGYKFNDDADLVVLRIDDATSAAETLTLNSDYTVQGAGNEAGGSVTMVAPLDVGKTLTITRIVDILQLTDLRNQGKFFAEVHEDAFDKFIMIMQQLFQAVGDSLQLNAARNRWDAKGRRIVNVGDPVDAQDAVTKSWLESYIAALLQTSVGPVQTAASVIIVAPNGDVFTLQDLANPTDPTKGAAIVGRGVVAVDTVAEMQALPASAKREDLKYLVQGTVFSYSSVSATFTPVDYVSFLGYGGDILGASDCSAAIQNALNEYDNVVIPQGAICRCDTMIEVNAGKTLYIQAGATLKRFAANSVSTDPVVWIKGSEASVFGDNRRTSLIITENRCPRGVLRLGHKDMTESHANVTYCAVNRIGLIGPLVGGQTTGEPDVCLYMPNPQFNSLASYFHTVNQIFMANANIGLWLHGWANGNIMGGLQGIQLGNTTLVGEVNRAFIRVSGALDNTITDAFFHKSANSMGLVWENLDNTANGGSVHSVYANSFKGLVFEQGGASARGIYATTDGGSSFFEIKDNVAGSNILPAGFMDKNLFFSLGTSNKSLREAARVQKERIINDQNYLIEVANEKGFSFNSMIEGASYNIFSIAVPMSYSSVLVEVSATYRPGLGITGGSHKLIINVGRESGSGDKSLYSLAVMEYKKPPKFSGNFCELQNGNLVFQAPSNGTASANGKLDGFVRIIGGSITIPDTLTSSVSAGVPLATT